MYDRVTQSFGSYYMNWYNDDDSGKAPKGPMKAKTMGAAGRFDSSTNRLVEDATIYI